MPPRLNHRKSRNGCRRCKFRRVKCDEKYPTCSNCIRHQVVCEYAIQPSNSSSTSGRSGLDVLYAEDATLEDATLEETKERRLLEMQLIHHFTSVVTRTFPSSNGRPILDMWGNYAVVMSFQHPFLLNTILAVSALHLSRGYHVTHPKLAEEGTAPSFKSVQGQPASLIDKTIAAKVHRIYLNLAVRQQREALSDVNADNSNALFLSTILLSHLAMGIENDDYDPGDYGPPVHWLHMIVAIREMADYLREFVKDTTMFEVIIRGAGEPDFADVNSIFKPEFRLPFMNLLDWTTHPEMNLDAETRAAYESALSYVGGIYQGIQRRESHRILFRRILCMGLMVSSKFISFIEQRRPRALVILAYYSAMAIVLDDHWIFKGWAKREVSGLKNLIPAEWQWAMEWPQTMIITGQSCVYD
jgi:Fungal Zn(2)-Cys(6) binuclear cluster domain/Fungal specific transcription factor domain